MIVERQDVAENDELRLLRAPRQTRRHDVGRRHAAVGGLMMLVDAYAFEAELIGQLQFIEIAIVERMAELRIVKRIGGRHPGAVMRLREILRQVCPGHQMKAVDLHSNPIRRFERLERFERFELLMPSYGFQPAFLSSAATSAAKLKSNTS